MIVPDISILLYAYSAKSPLHDRARTWLERVLSGDEPVGFSWTTICGFLRIATDLRLPGERFSIPEAVAIVGQWLELPHVHLLTPSRKHWEWLHKAIEEGQVRGALVSDADLAALTMEHGGTLHTTDRDFARFPGLRWTNPLPAEIVGP